MDNKIDWLGDFTWQYQKDGRQNRKFENAELIKKRQLQVWLSAPNVVR